MMSRSGFTLIEALVATTITAVAGSALLLGVAASINSTRVGQEQIIADGLAQQLMDEIAGKKYCELSTQPYQYPLGPSSGEQAGPGRTLYDDIGDYDGLRNAPPTDMWNVPLGEDAGGGATREAAFQVSNFLSNWRQEVDVYYVSSTDLRTKLSAGQTSDYKCVEVRILIDDPNGARRTVTTLKRVFANVPNIY